MALYDKRFFILVNRDNEPVILPTYIEFYKS
jgi:hypothetical protein